MNNFLSNISFFTARRAEEAPQVNAALPSSAAGGGDGPGALQAPSLLPPTDEPSAQPASHGASAKDRPGAGARSDPAGDDCAQGPAVEPMPLVAYAARREEQAPPKARQSRALNMTRVSTSVAMTSDPMPTTDADDARPREPRLSTPFLTGTEKVRLQIMQVQLRLTSLSLYEGPIDGNLSTATVTALRYFQTLKGMRDTGTLAAGTLSALGVPPIT
jgi:hypothetical protein